jgi:hypothetical protein
MTPQRSQRNLKRQCLVDTNQRSNSNSYQNRRSNMHHQDSSCKFLILSQKSMYPRHNWHSSCCQSQLDTSLTSIYRSSSHHWPLDTLRTNS